MGDHAPERIELGREDDVRDAIHRAAACLANDGLVALPTETSYVLAARALAPASVHRLRGLKQLPASHPMSVGLRSADELRDWVPDLPELTRRISRRAWPGPLTLIVRGDCSAGLASHIPPAVREAIVPGDTIGFRLPAHEVVREVMELVQGPIVLTDAPAAGGHARSARDLESLAGLSLILDDGPTPSAERNSVVQCHGQGWEVIRPGALGISDLQAMFGTMLLFVCTGNTCRSPMAEALCRLALARRLDCRPEEVAGRGFVVTSAGLAAHPGDRAASEAAEVVRSMGGDLKDHSSRPVSPALMDAADWIVAMTDDHREALLDAVPEALPRVRLLDPQGEDIPDPIGMDRETYRRTAEKIARSLEILLRQIGIERIPGS